MTLTLQEALNSLPTDPDEIAARLVQEGCFGNPRMCCQCPIAVFVARRVGHVVDIDNGFVSQFDGQMLSLSRGVRNFVHRFDSGQYPQLEACK